jgi:hypothetical protein
MSENPTHRDDEQPEGDVGQDEQVGGVEIGATDGEGSTFEPEEDPEAAAR